MQQMVDAILYDQEGRNGLGLLHWIVYGIDASTTSLPEGAGDGERPGLVGGSNFLGKGSYYGGCPPKGTGPHHYVFTIIATDLDSTALKPGLTMQQMVDARLPCPRRGGTRGSLRSIT